MRTILLALGLAVLTAGCSNPEFYDMEPGSVSFDLRGATKNVRAVAKNRRGQVFPTQKPTAWTSSDEGIAKVDEDGLITAMGPGRARITATRGKLVGEVMVDVNSVEQLVVEPAELAFKQDGDPVRLTIETLDMRGKPLRDRNIQARCVNEKVCTMDRSHQIWPHDPGETVAEISCDGHKKSVKVVVTAARR